MKHKEMLDLMGKVVVVEQKLKRVTEKRESYWITEKVYKERPGWIVGFRNLQFGHIRDNGWDEPGVFIQNGKTIQAVLVSYWPTMAPEKVPLGGYRPAGEDERPYFNTYQWSDTERKQWSEEIKSAKRDDKGRFVK